MINPGSRNQDNVNNNFNDIIPHVRIAVFLIKAKSKLWEKCTNK